MRLPNFKQSFMRIVHFGRQVLTRLRRTGENQLAEGVAAVTQRVLEAGRGIEDAVLPVQEAIAYRDLTLGMLEDAVRDLRVLLMGRGREASSQPPYIDIFPEGVGQYTNNTLDETVRLYRQLISRMNSALPEDDAVRVEFVERITAGLKQFAEAVDELEAARNEVDIARTLSAKVRRAWNDEMLKVYGALVGRYGKKGAERYFPKWRKKPRRKSEGAKVAATAPEGKASKPAADAKGKASKSTPDAGGKGSESASESANDVNGKKSVDASNGGTQAAASGGDAPNGAPDAASARV